MTINELEQALRTAREQGDRREEAVALDALGVALLAQGNLTEALSCGEGAYALARDIRDRALTGFAARNLARIYEALGRDEDARQNYWGATLFLSGVGNKLEVARTRWACGQLLFRQGERQSAIELMELCVAYEQQVDDPQAAEHLALVEQLRAGGDLPV
jgi:hypothetical protein